MTDDSNKTGQISTPETEGSGGKAHTEVRRRAPGGKQPAKTGPRPKAASDKAAKPGQNGKDDGFEDLVNDLPV